MPCLTPYRGDTSQMLLFKIASCLEAGGGGGGVTSFNGFTGAVTGVDSFNGRTGAVILSLADVAAVADGRYVLKAGDTMTGPLNMTAGQSYQYNGVNVIRAQTALSNYFFGPSGNLTMTGGFNTAVGDLSLPVNTTGSSNTSIGFGALFSNTTGLNNTAIGYLALGLNTSGIQSVAIGVNSLLANTTGSFNTGVGYQALFTNTTGQLNTAVGFVALFLNTTGSLNTAIGYESLRTNVTGMNNTGIGYRSLFDVTTGSQNTGIGYNTGLGITTGVNNTIIGATVTGLAAALSNNIIIADGAGNQRINVDSSGNTTFAGTVATADGTAALPAKTFSADTDTGIYRIGANSIGTSTSGVLRITTNTTDIILATAFRLAFASGANQRAGNAVLVGGTVTVANTSVTANTIILLTRKTAGGTIGFAVTYTVIAATSFTITSDNVLDTSTYSYLLIEVP